MDLKGKIKFKRVDKYIEVNLTDEQKEFVTPEKRINNAIGAKDYFAYDIFCENERIGFVILYKESDECMNIFDIMIDKNFQNKGYGRYILHFLIEKFKEKGFKKVVLACVCKNNVAMSFYKKLGFQPIFERECMDLIFKSEKNINTKKDSDLFLIKDDVLTNFNGNVKSEDLKKCNDYVHNYQDVNGFYLIKHNEKIAYIILQDNCKIDKIISNLSDFDVLKSITQCLPFEQFDHLNLRLDKDEFAKFDSLKSIGFEIYKQHHEFDMEKNLD